MFYSQFILAKKGPLGTIWIAAHLERKLRKNQVADTDIGVSVDSILFPDAPIALRLSSHLLLGVVRIYSKKVNYLFNDCSEALIKIKHAFRSTAVDLPPEESTAPYHSITLPENFDLDNFELPDSAFLDSNFVDHHVSTREQITLQDTVNETAFPTSKFGLDERFGDEDASQIDLELDEELFMDKADPPEHDEVQMISKNSGLYHGETSVPSTSKAVDVQFGGDVEKYNDTSNELSELLSNNFDKSAFSVAEDVKKEASSSHRHGYATQTPDLNEIFQPDCPTSLEKHIPLTPNDVQTPCSVELAQEPSTPALLEVVPSHLQEDPVLSPQEKADTCVESSKPRSITSPHMEIDSSEAGNKTIHASTELDIKYEESVQGLHLSPALIRSVSESITPTCPNWNSGTDNAQFVSAVEYEVNNISTADRRLVNDGAISTSLLSHEASALMPPPKLVASFPATFKSSTDNMDASGAVLHVAMKGSNDSTEIANSGHLQDARSCLGTSTSGSDLFSSPCNSKLHIPSSSFIQTAPIESELATSNIHTDKMDVSGVNLDLEKAPIKNSNEKSSPRHGEVGDSDFSTSMAGSDFFLRSCSSNLHLPNTLFVGGALGGNSEFPIGDHCFSQKTSRREEVQNINRHFEVQDDDRFNYLEGQDTSGYTTSDFKYGGRKPVEQLSTGVMSKVSHLDNEMCSPSSEFLGPEKMLASTFDDFSTYQVLQASDKGLMQSDGIADRNSSPFSRKRHLLDSPTVPQTSSSAKSSEYPRTKSRSGYVLDGNDVLTTILDERSAPSLKTGSIPPLTSKTNSVLPLSSKTGSVLPVSKLSSQKRPRAIPKVVLSKKRKVLVDDAMSLHADVIRQQLINTEDIRRMRKKAPCSRPEIWKIYIGAMEEDVFDRSILAGISVELNSSSNLKDDTPKDPSFLELNSQAKTSENTGSSRVSGIFRDMGDKQMNHRILSAGTVDSSSPSSITESVSVQTHESDMLDHLKKLPVQPQAGPFRKDQTSLTGQSRVSEFLNEGSTKEFNEKISSVNNMTSRNEIPSNITAPATLKAHQFGAQCGTHVQLPKVPIHSRVGPSSNNQAGVLGSSTGFEFINEINDNEINERVSSVHRNSPSSLNSSVTVQVHEVGAQHDLYDQLRNLPVQPQVGSLKNKQASMIRGMQPDAEICRTSIIQGTTIPENITPAKSSGETGMNMKSNERNSSLSSIVNRNFGLQSHEDDAHYDIYGQLNKLPVQQDVLSFNNDHAPVIREMQFDIETHPTIIQELTIPETVKSFSPVEKLAVQSSNQVEYDTRAKMFGVTGSSRLLPFSSAMGETEMIESISSDPRTINRSFGSASMTASVSEQPYDDGTHYDHYGQFNNLPVQPQVGSMIRATLPRVGAQPHSIIQEIHIPEIGSSNSSIEKITDKSVAPQVGFNNFDVQYDPHCLIEKLPVQLESGSFRDDQMFDAVRHANSIILEPPIPEIDKNTVEIFSNKSISLTRSPLKPLNTPNEVSDRTIGDNAVKPFATQFHVQAGDAVINTGGKAGNAMHTGHLESIYTNDGNTGTKLLYKQSHMLVETVSSAVVVDADGTVDALGDRGRLVSDATRATQNEGDIRPVSGAQCTEHTPSTVGRDNSINDCNVEGEMGIDNMSLDIPVGRESNDFCSAIDDNYPGFLNEDYEDAVVDEADANMSNSENAQSLENTGWSARTRGVAKYLKNLFDEESGQGRTSVAMNRLLVGKTRKEASRMFFETLVLKTRDYIQVEQKHPYDWIDITPRTKLLKSDF